ncbi:MAG TPA: CocE/NonD family hydrolase [Chthonomonadaceae bacterium]|nr:CocE/NonD family hydrolase [Chthonomonadaceae bacterium]
MRTSIRRFRSAHAALFALSLLAGGMALVAAPSLRAQQKPAAPQKQTILVAMSDGVKLATDVYLPEGKGPFPVILLRTPYDKNAGAGLGADGARRGYALVIQDTRGRGASEGENLPFVGDLWEKHRDGYDTLEWIAKQPWCNGKIGSFGGSALGITQLGMAGAGTTRLACQHIAVATPNFYRDAVFPGGIFKKAMIEDWLRGTKHSPESLKIWTRHPTYDAFWRGQDLTTRWNKVNAPAIHLGGWYDIFTQGTIDTFLGYQTRGGPNARGKQKLLLGPWTHGILQNRAGELTFPNANAPPNAIADPWRWFDYYLKGEQNGMDTAPAVTYYVMGDVSDPKAPGNVWRTAATWPPVETKPTPFYLHADRTLSTTKPAADAPLTYAYDPKDPVPTVGGPQLTIPAGPMDQRRIESRPDVLVFTSEPLAAPLEVTGRVRVTLHAASDAPDTDFFAKLCDVYPDGRSINICEGQLRARFRESFQREQPLKPGQIATFDIDLSSTSIIFNRGHRLRVQIASSSAPGYDPNPNTGEPFRASDRTQVAHNTVYLDAQRPSYLLLPVAADGLPAPLHASRR